MRGLMIDGSQTVGLAGCELAWMYCRPDRQTPRAIWLVLPGSGIHPEYWL